MNQRQFILVAVSLLAGAILALTWLLGPATSPSAAPIKPTVQPGQTPPPLKPATSADGTASAAGDSVTPVAPSAGSAQGYILRSTTRQGIPVQITGQTLDPLPNGYWKVTRPMTRIQLSPQRLIQIQAEEGTILAPANQPRSGELRGHVTLFFFESPANRPVNLAYGSPDLTMRLRLDDARFDLELGQIESQGPVELEQMQFAFQGRGLSMTFNQLRQRLDHLEVFEGKSLRLKTRNTSRSGNTEQSSNPIDATTNGDERPPVYYQVRIFDAVQMKTPQATLTGQIMRVLFALTSESGTPLKDSTSDNQTPQGQNNSSLIPEAESRGTGTQPAAERSDSDERTTHDASIFVPEPDDTFVQWEGRLLVEPLPDKPKDLAGPRDMQLALAGSPVEITTVEDDHITAGLVEYLLSGDQLRLKGNTQNPVEIRSKELGLLTLPELVLVPREGRGVILGGGQLQGSSNLPGTAVVNPEKADKLTLSTSALPEGMTIVWSDRLHLSFDAQKPEKASLAQSSQLPTGRIGPLREALFTGNVRVIDPRLHLQADQLAATLASSRALSAKSNSPTRLEKLTAQGNVRVQTQPSSQATRDQSADPSKVMDLEALTLNCDQLSVHMDESGKQSAQPRELLATGRVDAQTAEHRIQAGQMRVLLVPGQSSGIAKETDQKQLQVESITARDNVTLQALALQATLTGTQVVIDTRKQKLTAVGDGNKPAHLRLPDATLTASQMVLDQARQKLTTPVSGVFIFLERDPRDPAAPPAVVTTQWSRDMSFDQAAGQVLFRGNVRTDSVARRDTMKLTCDELAVLFDPSSAQGDQVNASRDVRQVKTLAARHNVVFESVNWIDRPEGQPATRLNLQGPDLLFENARQAVQILGPGRMLFEDYRLPQVTVPANANEPTTNASLVKSPLQFAGGRGATLFTWQGQLTFDVAGNDMTMVDTVQMTHRPADSPHIVTLDCSRFMADLQPTGGLSSWASGTAPQPDLRSITALGPVNVTVGGNNPLQVQTSKLVYDGKAQSVLLQAEPGSMTTVQETGQPGISAEAIRWDLTQQRWEIIRPGAGRLPLGR